MIEKNVLCVYDVMPTIKWSKNSIIHKWMPSIDSSLKCYTTNRSSMIHISNTFVHICFFFAFCTKTIRLILILYGLFEMWANSSQLVFQSESQRWRKSSMSIHVWQLESARINWHNIIYEEKCCWNFIIVFSFSVLLISFCSFTFEIRLSTPYSHSKHIEFVQMPSSFIFRENAIIQDDKLQ